MLKRSAIAIAVLSISASLALAQDWSVYVWQKLQVAPPAQPIGPYQEELAQQVQEILEAGPLAPAPFTVGISGTYFCYANSGELVYALCEALPYLPQAMQPKVVEYVKGVVRRNPPWSKPLLGSDGAWLLYAPKPPNAPRLGRLEPPAVNAYFAWKYADATGDWESVGAAYPAIAREVSSAVRGTPATYPQILAIIGMARLARHLGRASDAQAAAAMAVKGLQAGADYEKFFMTAYGKTVTRNHDWGYPPFTESRRPAVVTGFGPEIGRMLRDHALAAVKAHADPVMDQWDPTWFMTRANMPTFYGQYYFKPGPAKAPAFMKNAWTGAQSDFGQENSYLTPDVGWGLFMIRAYVYGESAAKLARYLDVPWTRVGDVYYLEKLVAVIRAQGKQAWAPVQ